MSLIAALLVLANTTVVQPIEKSDEWLNQAKLISAKLSDPTELSIVHLTIAQAQIRKGAKPAALDSLRQGWKAYLKMPNGRPNLPYDPFTLMEEGDFATLPEQFGVEFLSAGSLADAKAAADSFSDTPLGKSFRHGLGMKIRDRFPEAFEVLAFTDAERAERAKKKTEVLAGIDKMKEEPDVLTRTFKLYQAADTLMMLGATEDAIKLLKSLVELVPSLPSKPTQAMVLAQTAYGLWNMGAKTEATSALNEAIKIELALEGTDKESLRARLAVEQTRKWFGVPNKMADIEKEMDRQAGVIVPPAAITPTPNPASKDPYELLTQAEVLISKKDKAGAAKLLKKIGPLLTSKNDPDGWLQVLVGERQVQADDKVGANANLGEGSKRYLASLKPATSYPGEEFYKLMMLARDQISAGNEAGGVKTMKVGIENLAAGKAITDLTVMSPGKSTTMKFDRQSPILHHGAICLAKLGAFDEAVAMARKVQNNAHRAIALAAIAREHG